MMHSRLLFKNLPRVMELVRHLIDNDFSNGEIATIMETAKALKTAQIIAPR